MSAKNNMEKKFRYNKKALSAVVVTLILIVLAMVAVTIVWVVVNKFVTEGLEEVESCVNIFDKVQINERYTCYNSSSHELQFSISIGDLEVEKILVSISGGGSSKGFEITNSPNTIDKLFNYTERGSLVVLPNKNSGLTYIYNLSGSFTGSPDVLEIAPNINAQQCSVSDSVSEFSDCSLL